MGTNRSERIEALTMLFLTGKTRLDDARALYASKGWAIKDRQLFNDRQLAWESIKNEIGEQKQYLYALSVTRLERLFGKAIEAGNLRESLNIMKELNRLCGLY